MSVLNSGKYKSMLGFKHINVTWANRPSASAYADEIIFASDIGANGTYFMSNGTYWVPVGGEAVLAKSGASASFTGAVAEQSIVSYTLPGGLMTPWSQLEIIVLWTYTNSANTKILRVRHTSVGGGVSGNVYFYFAGTTTASVQNICAIRSNNSIAAQKGWGIGTGGVSGLGALNASLSAYNRNLANDSDIVLTGQLASSGETITVDAYTITLRS